MDDIKDGRGLAIADFNNDGALDLVINNNPGDNGKETVPATLLVNNVGARRSWLAVALVGVRCNRDAVGTMVLAEMLPSSCKAQPHLARQLRHNGRLELSSRMRSGSIFWPRRPAQVDASSPLARRRERSYQCKLASWFASPRKRDQQQPPALQRIARRGTRVGPLGNDLREEQAGLGFGIAGRLQWRFGRHLSDRWGPCWRNASASPR